MVLFTLPLRRLVVLKSVEDILRDGVWMVTEGSIDSVEVFDPGLSNDLVAFEFEEWFDNVLDVTAKRTWLLLDEARPVCKTSSFVLWTTLRDITWDTTLEVLPRLPRLGKDIGEATVGLNSLDWKELVGAMEDAMYVAPAVLFLVEAKDALTVDRSCFSKKLCVATNGTVEVEALRNFDIKALTGSFNDVPVSSCVDSDRTWLNNLEWGGNMELPVDLIRVTVVVSSTRLISDSPADWEKEAVASKLTWLWLCIPGGWVVIEAVRVSVTDGNFGSKLVILPTSKATFGVDSVVRLWLADKTGSTVFSTTK